MRSKQEFTVLQGVETLPESYQVQCGYNQSEMKKLLLLAVPTISKRGDCPGSYYRIDSTTVSIQEGQFADTPVIEYSTWKRILEAKISSPVQVPVEKVGFKVGDWIVPIVEVDTVEYELGAAKGVGEGVAYEISRVHETSIDVKPSGMSVCKCDVRPATESEIAIAKGEAKSTVPVDEIKVGTWAVCKPGYLEEEYGDTYGGAGYEEGRVFKVGRIAGEVYWPEVGSKGSSCGVFTRAARVATKEEVDAVTKEAGKVSEMPVKSSKKLLWNIGDKFQYLGRDTVFTIDRIDGNEVVVVWPNNEVRYDISTANENKSKDWKEYKEPITTPKPWYAITTDGVKVYREDKIWWVSTMDKTHTADNVASCFKSNIEAKIAGNGYQSHEFFSSKEAADKYIAEQKGEKVVVDGWKVGDYLPVEWLNTIASYYQGKKQVPGGFICNRTVKSVDNGIATIAGSYQYTLGPKSEYPTYNSEVVNNKSKQIVNQTTKTTKQNVNNNEESSKQDSITGSRYNIKPAYDLRTEVTSVPTGKGRAAVALECQGQPEYTVRHNRSN